MRQRFLSALIILLAAGLDAKPQKGPVAMNPVGVQSSGQAARPEPPVRTGAPESTTPGPGLQVRPALPDPGPPPLPKAVKNPQGFWEGDQDLGPCRLRMVAIPAGTVLMGEAPDPCVVVTLTHGFWMGKYPVTQAQWQAVMESDPSRFKGPDLPVEMVSWEDCQRFIKRLQSPESGTFRLPTEAEWEFACRAGSTGERYGDLNEIAWYEETSQETTHPVGRLRPNAFGLYDMLGNVRQWCQDWGEIYAAGEATDPQGPATGTERVYRGGSWATIGKKVRSAFREGAPPDRRSQFVGFRLLRTMP